MTATAAADRKATFLDLIFGHEDNCRSCGRLEDISDLSDGLCHSCFVINFHSAQAQNADELAAPSLGPTADLLKPNFTKGGRTDPVFNESLDTGHYDDGHSFGWGIKSKSEVIQVEHHVIDDIIEGQPQRIMPDLEVAAALDLNGNGQIDQPGGSGQQVTTIIGPPTIL